MFFLIKKRVSNTPLMKWLPPLIIKLYLKRLRPAWVIIYHYHMKSSYGRIFIKLAFWFRY